MGSLLGYVDARGAGYLVCFVDEALTGPVGMALTKLTSPNRETPDERKGRSKERVEASWRYRGSSAGKQWGATGQADRQWWGKSSCERKIGWLELKTKGWKGKHRS